MSNNEAESSLMSDRRSARGQAMLAVLVGVVFACLFAVAQVAVAHDDLLLASRVARWKRIPRGLFVDARLFPNYGERLLYETLPAADYSHGGVYFSGASVTGSALMPWDWPAADQQRIHNYCVPNSTISQESRFIHYLADEEGLINPGGRTTVIIELFFGSASNAETPEFKNGDRQWRSYFLAHGIYKIGPSEEIEPSLRFAARSLVCRGVRAQLANNWTLQFVGLPKPPETLLIGQDLTPETKQIYRDFWSARLGPDWARSLDSELNELSRLIDFLRSRQAGVAAVFVPVPPWAAGFDRAERFHEAAASLVSTKSIETLDLSTLLDESGFADSVHMNYSGATKIQPKLVAFAEKILGRIDEQLQK